MGKDKTRKQVACSKYRKKHGKKFTYNLKPSAYVSQPDLTSRDDYGEDWSELEGRQSALDRYSLKEMRQWYADEVEDFIDDIYGDDCEKEDLY